MDEHVFALSMVVAAASGAAAAFLLGRVARATAAAPADPDRGVATVTYRTPAGNLASLAWVPGVDPAALVFIDPDGRCWPVPDPPGAGFATYREVRLVAGELKTLLGVPSPPG